MPLTSATFLLPILTTTSFRGSYLGSRSLIFSEVCPYGCVLGRIRAGR